MPSESSKIVGVLYTSASYFGFNHDGRARKYAKVKCSWYQAAAEGKTYLNGYALLCLNLEVHILEEAHGKEEERYKTTGELQPFGGILL